MASGPRSLVGGYHNTLGRSRATWSAVNSHTTAGAVNTIHAWARPRRRQVHTAATRSPPGPRARRTAPTGCWCRWPGAAHRRGPRGHRGVVGGQGLPHLVGIDEDHAHGGEAGPAAVPRVSRDRPADTGWTFPPARRTSTTRNVAVPTPVTTVMRAPRVERGDGPEGPAVGVGRGRRRRWCRPPRERPCCGGVPDLWSGRRPKCPPRPLVDADGRDGQKADGVPAANWWPPLSVERTGPSPGPTRCGTD